MVFYRTRNLCHWIRVCPRRKKQRPFNVVLVDIDGISFLNVRHGLLKLSRDLLDDLKFEYIY